LIDAEQKAAAASSSSNNNVIETTSNINDNNSNPNADLISGTTESVTPVDSSNNENYVTEDTKAKSATSLNTGNQGQDNNEASAKINVETKQDNQNKELTAEVCEFILSRI